jgi:hypothetical protein
MEIDKHEMPEHHAHGRMGFFAFRSKNAGMLSLTASRFNGTCIDLRI